MEIGWLRHKIAIEQRAETENSLGEDVGAWAAVFPSLSACAEPIRGREYFAASQAQSSTDVKFTIRYRTGIDETMRVMWKGEAYEIVSAPINVQGRNRWLELMCTKGIRGGRNG